MGLVFSPLYVVVVAHRNITEVFLNIISLQWTIYKDHRSLVVTNLKIKGLLLGNRWRCGEGQFPNNYLSFR